jgi:hypothetical protein
VWAHEIVGHVEEPVRSHLWEANFILRRPN